MGNVYLPFLTVFFSYPGPRVRLPRPAESQRRRRLRGRARRARKEQTEDPGIHPCVARRKKNARIRTRLHEHANTHIKMSRDTPIYISTFMHAGHAQLVPSSGSFGVFYRSLSFTDTVNNIFSLHSRSLMSRFISWRTKRRTPCTTRWSCSLLLTTLRSDRSVLCPLLWLEEEKRMLRENKHCWCILFFCVACNVKARVGN